MHITHKNCNKLRAGQTVWRSLIWFDLNNKPVVRTTEILLQGPKTIHFFGPGHTPLKVGKYFLNDIAFGSYATTSRRASKRFEKEVKEGLHKDLVQERRDWLYKYCQF
jgi:hypothetical protein